MQRVGPVILDEIVCDIVNCELAVANAVGIAPWDGIIDWMPGIDS
jgi:hypothetical protein